MLPVFTGSFSFGRFMIHFKHNDTGDIVCLQTQGDGSSKVLATSYKPNENVRVWHFKAELYNNAAIEISMALLIEAAYAACLNAAVFNDLFANNREALTIKDKEKQ